MAYTTHKSLICKMFYGICGLPINLTMFYLNMMVPYYLMLDAENIVVAWLLPITICTRIVITMILNLIPMYILESHNTVEFLISWLPLFIWSIHSSAVTTMLKVGKFKGVTFLSLAVVWIYTKISIYTDKIRTIFKDTGILTVIISPVFLMIFSLAFMTTFYCWFILIKLVV